MGGVRVASGKDLIITKERINIDGIPINPKTKKPLHPIEKEYIPPPPHVLEAWKKEADEKREKEEGLEPLPDTHPNPSGGLKNIISKKLEEKIGEAISEAVEKIDVGGMIDEALNKALKQ